MITVRKLKDGTPRYLVRYETPFGREVAKTFSRKAEAEAWERSMKDAARTGIGLPAPRELRMRTVGELWLDVLASRSSRWEAKTRRRYEELYALHVGPEWARWQAAAVTSRGVRLWVERIRAAGMASSTAAQAVTVLSWVMREAIEAGIRVDNPTTGGRPRASAPIPRKSLAADEVARLVAAAGAEDAAVFFLAATTGPRFGELVGLDVGDVDVEQGVLHVQRVIVEVAGLGQVVKQYPKAGATARRSVGLPPEVVAVLGQLIDGRELMAPLWPNVTGGRQWYSSALRRLRAAMTAAGIAPGAFHTLRRTAATLALQHGANIRDVQSMLGHASPIMTLTRYAQPDVAQQRAATGRVAGAILAVSPGQNPDK